MNFERQLVNIIRMIIFTITDVFITIVCVLCKPSPCLRGGRRESSPCCWRWPSESSRVQKKRKFTLLLKMAIRPWAIPAPIFNKSASPSLGLLAGPCKGKRKRLSRANSVIVEYEGPLILWLRHHNLHNRLRSQSQKSVGPGWRGRGPRGNKPDDETDENIALLTKSFFGVHIWFNTLIHVSRCIKTMISFLCVVL